MTRIRIRPFAKTASLKSVVVLSMLLSACTAPGSGGLSLPSFTSSDSEAAPQFSRGSLDQLWATTPEALVMVQRGGRGEGVQIIGLENSTTLEGDNFLWLRAHSKAAGRFDLEQIIADVGGIPLPFRSLSDRDLRTGTDSLGSYSWKEWRSGTQINCVLAFRRLGSGARNLPKGARAMDAFLRNCVNGPIEEALQPITDNRIGRSTIAGNRSRFGSGGNLSMSPLAGPRQ